MGATTSPIMPQKAEQRMIDSFLATARPLSLADRGLLHELAVGVFWPHRGRDLDLLLRLGRGYIATDEIGRAMGSTMAFESGEDFAFLGMMVVAPRLQAQGTGRWLLRLVLRDCGARDFRLTATKSGFPLYESEGFVPQALIRQHQGVARSIHLPDPVSGLELRPLTAEDHPEILALDAHAYGASRPQMLEALYEKSEGMVALSGGKICGFALMRNFGRGRVIGPIVAERDRIAMQMIAPLIQAHEGQFLRVDCPTESPVFEAFLAAAGLGVYDTVTEMSRGTHRRASQGPVTFGMASHSIG
ncbi:MAG: GNAT family N-acetyltransferase [Mangrovicoccus sp.]